MFRDFAGASRLGMPSAGFALIHVLALACVSCTASSAGDARSSKRADVTVRLSDAAASSFEYSAADGMQRRAATPEKAMAVARELERQRGAPY